MEALARVVSRLVDSDVPLRRSDLLPVARQIATEEAPLEGPGLASAAVDALVGLGPLEVLLSDAAISDVLVNGAGDVWVERSGVLERTSISMGGPGALVAAVERVIAPLGLRLDRASPAVDARLPDGSRLHAMIPPASVDGPVVAIRRFTPVVPDLEALVACESITREGAEALADAVAGRQSILVGGGTGSGKTTLLNILSREVSPTERMVTIEDSAELHLSGHVVRLEARPPNAEGAGEITLRALVRHALRMRPDRIVVGEVRGPEALDLIQAMSTGHPGSMGTVHANGPEEALWRLETLALSGEQRVPESAVRRLIRSAIDLLVQMERRGGRRMVSAIASVEGDRIEERYRC